MARAHKWERREVFPARLRPSNVKRTLEHRCIRCGFTGTYDVTDDGLIPVAGCLPVPASCGDPNVPGLPPKTVYDWLTADEDIV